jgi:hypothetical protein
MDVLRTSSAESIQTNEAVALEAIFGVRSRRLLLRFRDLNAGREVG